MMGKFLVLGMFAIFSIVKANEQKCLTYIDVCERICTNTEQGLKCYRQRKEFTNMDDEERIRYTNTVKIASTNPLYKTEYEELLTMHMELFNGGIHEQCFFLPWHRWFVLQYENLLRKIDCRVTVPFWDWSRSSEDLLSSDFWDPLDGFGGNGHNDGVRECVITGPFGEDEWSLIESAGGGCLERNITSPSPNSIAVAILTYSGTYENFGIYELLLRTYFHDAVHCLIDGTMCKDIAASAPEFFLHHGFVDKMWSDYQNRGDAYKFHEFFTIQQGFMPGTNITPGEFLDLANQPGGVAVEYVQPRNAITSIIAEVSASRLQIISSLHLPPLSEKAIRLFHISPAERRKIRRLARNVFGKKVDQTSTTEADNGYEG